MFVIIKQIQNKKTGKTLPVILIDNLSEVLEFKKKEDANKLCEILNINSDLILYFVSISDCQTALMLEK